MVTKIYFVESLDNIKNQYKTPGNIFVLPNGDVFEIGATDELSGIGSFFKKLGKIALPLAGTIAAPFTGGISLALIGAGGAIGGGLLAGADAKGNAKIQAEIQAGNEVMAGFEQIKQRTATDPNYTDSAADVEKLMKILYGSDFNQSAKGDEGRAEEAFKVKAIAYRDEIKQLAAAADRTRPAAAAAPATVNLPNGQKVQMINGQAQVIQDSSFISGIPNQTLFIGAAVIGGIYYFTRN